MVGQLGCIPRGKHAGKLCMSVTRETSHFSWLVGWSVGWLVGWLVGQLVGWLYIPLALAPFSYSLDGNWAWLTHSCVNTRLAVVGCLDCDYYGDTFGFGQSHIWPAGGLVMATSSSVVQPPWQHPGPLSRLNANTELY